MGKISLLIILVIGLILALWRNSLLNINTHLIGKYDELFVLWIFQNNIQHFSQLDLSHLYETNALYPFKYTLSFAEQLFFPSFLAFLINFFNSNPIFHYNFLIISNQILIFLSSLLFFNKLLKNKYAALLSSFYSTLAPYFFTEISHFQMIYYWPLFICLYFLTCFIESRRNKPLIVAGIFLGLQFLSSIYLGIMSLVIITVFLFTQLVFDKFNLIYTLKHFFLILAVFFLVSGISFYGYYLVRQEYNTKRDYSEFILYSAHFTDYLFPNTRQNSFLYNSAIFSKIKSYNHHAGRAALIGLIPMILILYYLSPKIQKKQKNIHLVWKLDSLAIISIVLIVIGFVFSLGPRLSVNGLFADIPLPYHFLLKIFSPLEIMRAVVRWQFLIMIGAGIMIGLSYKKIEEIVWKKYPTLKFFLIDIFLVLFILEFNPLTPFPSFSIQRGSSSYQFLSNNICKNPGKAILEYPFNYRNLDGDLAKGVNYMASILLNSTQHYCKTLSGYYGYEPPFYIEIKNEFENGFDKKDIQLIKELKIDYIKFNKYAISDQELATIKSENRFNNFTILYEDINSIILNAEGVPVY